MESRSKTIPLYELLARMETGETLEEIEVTLIPPEDGPLTEEESGNEEDPPDMNHLPGKILRADVEIEEVLENRTDEDEEENQDEVQSIMENKQEDTRNQDYVESADESENEEVTVGSCKRKAPKTKKVVKKQKRGKKSNKKEPKKVCRKWLQEETKFTDRAGNGDENDRFSIFLGQELSCVQWFEKLLTPDIILLIKEQSNKYAMQNNCNLNLTESEIKVFIAILFLTGYLTPKNIRMFWETQSDTHNTLVSNSMRRNRFLEIQRFLHLADNNDLPINDKFGKVRQYLSLIDSNFRANFELIASSHISIDETMVPYYGKHGAKQHIHGKPIKFGYKLWSVATRRGYLISFEPYQGSKTAPLPDQERLGLGAAVVMELSSRLPERFGPYNFYFDRFFSSVKLIEALSRKNRGGTGTVLENRTEKCPLEDSKLLSKKPRGTFSFCNTDSMIVVKWQDNNIVTLISNCHGTEPVTKVDRIGTVDKKKVKLKVECPNITRKYNLFMGGVDRFDENLHSMRIGLRGKKWWYPLFAFGLDAACHNAWLLKSQTEPNVKLTYCQFRRAIVQEYCHHFGVEASHRARISNVPKLLPAARDSSSNYHELENCTEHRRCAECHKRTRKMCPRCSGGLHIHCTHKFHSKMAK